MLTWASLGLQIWVVVSLINFLICMKIQRNQNIYQYDYCFVEWITWILGCFICPFAWYYIWDEFLYEFLTNER